MIKVPYSNTYSPPAPILMIRLAIPEESAQLNLYSALIDTGADGTFVPTSILEQLALPVLYTTNARSYIGGGLHNVSVYEVDFFLETNRLPSIEVVADDWGDEIILGRNLLNKLELLLNGPKQITRVN